MILVYFESCYDKTFLYLLVEFHIILHSVGNCNCWLQTQISRQFRFASSGSWYYRYVRCKKYSKLQKDILAHNILFIAILWCCHIEEWLLLKGDPVALEPLWLTTVTMLSPSLLLQPHYQNHSRKINNVASSQPPQPQNKVDKSYGGILGGVGERSGLFYSWAGSEERKQRSINVADKGQACEAEGCVVSLLLANALKNISDLVASGCDSASFNQINNLIYPSPQGPLHFSGWCSTDMTMIQCFLFVDF